MTAKCQLLVRLRGEGRLVVSLGAGPIWPGAAGGGGSTLEEPQPLQLSREGLSILGSRSPIASYLWKIWKIWKIWNTGNTRVKAPAYDARALTSFSAHYLFYPRKKMAWSGLKACDRGTKVRALAALLWNLLAVSQSRSLAVSHSADEGHRYLIVLVPVPLFLHVDRFRRGKGGVISRRAREPESQRAMY